MNQEEKDQPYSHRTDTAPNNDTGHINSRNNNADVSDANASENTVRQTPAENIGDASVNDEKMTRYNSNTSANQ